MEIIFDKPTAKERSGAAPYFRPGVVLGDRFRVLEFAGETAYGEVYRAVELGRERPLLIQAIAPVLVGDAAPRERLERPAEVGGNLKHKNIVEACGPVSLPGHHRRVHLVGERNGG